MTGTSGALWIWWTTGAVLAAAGIFILYRALLHDRTRGRRRCPRCWYDLSGTAGLTCSECGHVARNERRLRRTRRSPRWAVLGLSIALLGTGLGSWPFASQFDWITIAPVWWLKQQGAAGSPLGLAAREEVYRRLVNDDLSLNQIDDLIEFILVIQADPNAFWKGQQLSRNGESWGRFIEQLWLEERLTETQIARYVRTAFDVPFKVTARSRIRAGQPLPLRIESRGPPRLSGAWWASRELRGMDTISHIGEIQSIRSGDIEIPIPTQVMLLRAAHSGGMMTTPTLQVDLPPGTHEIQTTWTFVARPHFRSKWPSIGRTLEPDPADLVRWERTIISTIEVIPQDEPVVRRVADATIHDEIRSAIKIHLDIRQISIAGTNFGSQFGMILVDPVPMDLSFDVICRADGVERKIGAIFARGKQKRMQNAQRITEDATLLFPHATVVDVILRTNVEAAERTLDSEAVWDGEIVFEDVPLRSPSATEDK